MHMDAFLWMFLPVFVACGSALLSFYIMQAKMEVAIAKERESLSEARATISSCSGTRPAYARRTPMPVAAGAAMLRPMKRTPTKST